MSSGGPEQDSHMPGWTEQINFSGSFLLMTCGVRGMTGHHWNEILPGTVELGPLFLSALPIKTKLFWSGGHDEKIMEQCRAQNHELGLVVSMVRPFEQSGAGLPVYPVATTDWAERGVKQLVYPMEDFSNNISLKKLQELANAVHQGRTEGFDGRKGVLVHCKAGVARSMLVVWAYLVLHCDMSVEASEALLREKRPQVAITDEKRALIVELRARHNLRPEALDKVDASQYKRRFSL